MAPYAILLNQLADGLDAGLLLVKLGLEVGAQLLQTLQLLFLTLRQTENEGA